MNNDLGPVHTQRSRAPAGYRTAAGRGPRRGGHARPAQPRPPPARKASRASQGARHRKIAGAAPLKPAIVTYPTVFLMTTQPSAPLTYRDAGVDIDAGDALVDRIKPLAARTMRPGVLAGIGGFGALFEVPGKYREPVLVSGTDGVGTKLRLAFEWNRHDTVGIDLVAMSVNDIL